MARILLIDDDADLSRYLQLAYERAEHGPGTLAAATR
jgi:hypothetical protein